MNRKYFAYAIIAILIAIFVGLHLSSAPAEARWVRCHMNLAIPPCDRDGGWVRSTDYFKHRVKCRAGHTYWICHAPSRREHSWSRCRAPAPTPAPTPAPAPTPTPAPAPTPTPAPRAQTPSQPVQTPPASPQQQSCTAPTLTYKKWVIGRSATDFSTTDKPTTFITNEKTSCTVKVEVSYNGSQGPNTCELTGVSVTVTMSHGFTVSGTPTVTPSGSGFSKVWKYEATFTGGTPQMINCDSGTGKYGTRGGNPITVTINATGTYSGGTVTLLEKMVKQDERDGMRQEYIDYNLHRTLKVLPSRGWFKSTLNVTAPDGSSTFTVSPRDSHYNAYKKTFPRRKSDNQEAFYNWGHYDYVIDSKTEANYAVWMQHVDKVQSGLRSEIITCRYRHPRHNRKIGGAEYSTHQYGYALDVRGKRKADGTKMSKTEREIMRDAANHKTDAAAEDADARLAYISGIPHVHADWAPTWWNAHRTSASAQLRDMTEARDARRPSTTNNNGGSSDDDDEDEDEDDDSDSDSGGSGDTAPAAPERPTTPTTVACGNRWRGDGACSSGGRASSRTAHESTCGAGHTYWSCNRTAVAWHATSYTCTRSGCGQTYTKCSKGNGSCRARRPGGGTYQWHD